MHAYVFYLLTGMGDPTWSAKSAFIDPSDLVAIVVIPSFCLMVGWLVWIVTRTNHLKTKSRIEMQHRLLEKIGSAKELMELMQTDDGRRFLESLATEQKTRHEQILSTVQTGVILTVIGLGSLSIRLFVPTGFGLFIVIGVFVGALGVGFVISAGVAYWLSKSWDLLDSQKAPSEMRDAGLFR